MKNSFFYTGFILIVFLFLTNYKAENKSMKVITYYNGVESEVTLNNEDIKRVKNILLVLLLKTDDMMRVYFDCERIEQIKNNEKCIEIILDKTEKFDTGFLGEVTLKKILLPLSGDFKPTEKIDIVTIIVGENDYSSGPLTASGGLKLVQELEETVFQDKR